jgi:hypothetical protein
VIREWRITLNGVPETLQQLSESKRVEIRFGKDKQGELYILTKADGKIYKIVSANAGSAQ